MKKEDYKCPFCDSHITKETYEKVIKENELLKKKAEQLEEEVKRLKNIEAEYRVKEKKFEQQKKDAVKDAIVKERQKLHGQLEGYDALIKKQKSEIELLKKGKTAQEVGFDFENEIYDILKKEFQQDDVEHTGKKGDVLLKIKSGGKIIGIILVECKKVQKHISAHIDEVKRHKIDAKADVGVLVTNGDFGKAKMDGFRNIEDILVIRPYSAVEFIGLLRKHIIEIDSLKLSEEEKNKERERLWNFIHSQDFESQMNSILRDVNKLKVLDSDEIAMIQKRSLIEENIIKANDLIRDGIKKIKLNNPQTF